MKPNRTKKAKKVRKFAVGGDMRGSNASPVPPIFGAEPGPGQSPARVFGGMMGDGGPDPRRVLLEALGDRTWSALQTREEGARSVERLYQLEIRASSLEWAEIRNPFGPARRLLAPRPAPFRLVWPGGRWRAACAGCRYQYQSMWSTSWANVCPRTVQLRLLTL